MIRRKKKDTSPFSLSDLSQRLRGLILDSQLPGAYEISYELGASAISDEVAEREEQESDRRLDEISYLLPLLYSFSKTLVEGAITIQKQTLSGAEKIPQEVWEQNQRTMESVTLATLMGSVSQLVDMGLLLVPKKVKK